MIQFLKNSRLPIKHGYFSRHGGVSKGHVASLNVSSRVHDDVENPQKNRKKACEAFGIDQANTTFLELLAHNTDIFIVDAVPSEETIINSYDVVMTNVVGAPISLSVADCYPVIIFDATSHSVAIVHCGWRGLASDILIHTMQRMQSEYGLLISTTKVGVGPGIAVDSYEVGSEVAAQFDSLHIQNRKNSKYLDLLSVIRAQCTRMGIHEIDSVAVDTYSNADYFSYRRDKGNTGRNFVAAVLE